MSISHAPRNPLVAALLYDGLCMFEFGVAAEVFGLDRPEFGDDWYRFVACAEERGPLRTNAGISITSQAGLGALAQAGTIVVPGWRTDWEPPSPALSRAVLNAHARGARLVTICSGAFLPASLGLLDGRRVTTHWKYADRLQRLCPQARVVPDVLYVDEGDILTSAGSSAGIDLLLHVVRKDFGSSIANRVARRLVMPPHRQGGQAQYVERPVAPLANDRLSPLLDDVRSSLSGHWTIARMARAAGMSERTFIRRFRRAIGESPGEWLIQQRVEAAREMLEAGAASLEQVATDSGFGSVESLRHHFRLRLATSPAAYRARFSRALPNDS